MIGVVRVMLDEEAVVELFESLGMDSVCARVFMSLIRLGGRARAQDISKSTGLSLSVIYRALNELQRHGLVRSSATKPKVYMVSDPKAIERLVEERVEKLWRRARELASAVSSTMVSKQGETLCTTLEEFREVLEILKYMAEQTEDELLLFIESSAIDELEPYISTLCRKAFVHVILSQEDAMKRFARSGCTIVSFRPFSTRAIAVSDGYRVLIAPLIGVDIAIAKKAVYIENGDVAHIVAAYFYERLYKSTLRNIYTIEEERPYAFRSIFTAVSFVRAAMSKGYELFASIEGFDTATHRSIKIEGRIVDYKDSHGITSIIVDAGNEYIAIGGLRAFAENISSYRLVIVPRRSR